MKHTAVTPNRPSNRIQGWLQEHYKAAIGSWQRFWSSILSTIFTSLTLAIALALPGSLLVLLNNADQITRHLQASAQVNVFLHKDIGLADAQQLTQQLAQREDIHSSYLISATAALDQFRQQSGLDTILDSLAINPLPHTIVLTPAFHAANQIALSHLTAKLDTLAAVDEVLVDLKWVQRLAALLETTRMATLGLALFLALAVMLVIGNTLRLAIENRREEIVVIKLVGGTDAYLRRPFLYLGCWYGLLSSGLAWLIIQFGLWGLQAPLQRLGDTYQTTIELVGLGLSGSVGLIISSVLLTMLSATITVTRELRLIEPH